MDKIRVKESLINNFQFDEAIKSLRTNLIFCGSNTKAIALTSAMENEGKSTISLNLAASLAMAGKNVVLVESDLRAGILLNTLKVRQRVKGLSHYLATNTNVEEIVMPTEIDGLNVIFGGARVVNSAELLGTEKFGELINKLKEIYDYIIVDAPPLGQVIDCAVMASKLDGILMVIDVKKNNYKLEKKVKAQIESAGGKVLGAVLNRVFVKEKKSNYYNNDVKYYEEKK